jgi:hypothetical protein
MRARSIGSAAAILMGMVFSATAAAPAGWYESILGWTTENDNDNAGKTWITPVGATRAWYTETDGLDVTLRGVGLDFWGSGDSGTVFFKPVEGDCEVMATIPTLPRDGKLGQWARSSLMMRGSNMRYDAMATFSRTVGTATVGPQLETGKRTALYGGTTQWNDFKTKWGSGYSFAGTNFNGDARLRMVRRGDTFTAWVSTNAPAYDAWTFIAEDTFALPEALNVGVGVSRWAQQTGGCTLITNTFGDVIVQNLVTATLGQDAAAVAWVNDLPLSYTTNSYAVAGYTVARQDTADGAFVDLGTTDAGTLSFSAALAASGVRCRYRVTANLTNLVAGSEGTNMLVGTSGWIRPGAITANPAPASLNGLATEYTENDSLVAARVDPFVYDSWTQSGTAVYPNGAVNGLGDLDYFKIYYNGSITVPETGLYTFVNKTDDILNLSIDGQLIIARDNWEGARNINSIPMWLEAGKSYPFNVYYQENSGGEVAQLSYVKGTASSTFTQIPQSWFEPFPLPWAHKDLSYETALYGNAVYNNDTGAFTITSAGAGLGGTNDDAHIIWQSTGATDCDLLATVASVSGSIGTAGGLNVRAAADDNAAMFGVQVVAASTGYRLDLIYRAAANTSAETVTLADSVTSPLKLRVSRRSGAYRIYYGTDAGWVSPTNLATSLTGTILAGMTASSGNGAAASATFQDVSLIYQPKTSFNVSVSDGNALISVPAIANAATLRQANKTLANAKWYWADALASRSYAIYRTDNVASNGTVIATIGAPAVTTYTDPLNVKTNTLVIYRLGTTYDFGAMADGSGDTNTLTVLSQAYGIADGTINAGGTGLYMEAYRGSYPTNLPVHRAIATMPGWEKYVNSVSTPFITAASSNDKKDIGPDNFSVNWSGTITFPYSGWYQFEETHDDMIDLWIGTQRVIFYWSWHNVYSPTAPMWYEAGQTVPISVRFGQGTGGGNFHLLWRNGSGNNGESYVEIPAACLKPATTITAPMIYTADGSNKFGGWANVNIGNATTSPGHVILTGDPAESFTAHIWGGGGDVWGTADGIHYLYKPIASDHDFELSATLIHMGRSGNGDWCKVGIIARDSLAANARNVGVMQAFNFTGNGQVCQHRDKVGGETANNGNNKKMGPPVTFRFVRKGNMLYSYMDDVAQTVYDVSGWGDTVYVGLFAAGNSGQTQADGIFTDVSLKSNYRNKTVIIIN